MRQVFSGHHHMICTMLKSCFNNAEPKLLNYRDYLNIFRKKPLKRSLAKLSMIVLTYTTI